MRAGTIGRWLAMVTLGTLLCPAATAAQERLAGASLTTRERVEMPRAPADQGAPAGASRPTRRQRMAVGAIVGAGIGAAVGEFALGRGLDFPHGPDMLIGAGAGAIIGALLARSSDRSQSRPKGAIAVVPILSPSRQSVLVTWRRR